MTKKKGESDRWLMLGAVSMVAGLTKLKISRRAWVPVIMSVTGAKKAKR